MTVSGNHHQILHFFCYQKNVKQHQGLYPTDRSFLYVVNVLEAWLWSTFIYSYYHLQLVYDKSKHKMIKSNFLWFITMSTFFF